MRVILMFLLFIIVISCSKTTIPEPISGFHSLERIYCECSPITLVPYQQQWRFDFEDSLVEVIVDGNVEDWLMFESGNYNLEFSETIHTVTGDTISYMLVNGREFNYFINNESIILSDPGASSDKGANYLFVQN